MNHKSIKFTENKNWYSESKPLVQSHSWQKVELGFGYTVYVPNQNAILSQKHFYLEATSTISLKPKRVLPGSGDSRYLDSGKEDGLN